LDCDHLDIANYKSKSLFIPNYLKNKCSSVPTSPKYVGSRGFKKKRERFEDEMGE
jgi:hypothetical protein